MKRLPFRWIQYWRFLKIYFLWITPKRNGNVAQKNLSFPLWARGWRGRFYRVGLRFFFLCNFIFTSDGQSEADGVSSFSFYFSSCFFFYSTRCETISPSPFLGRTRRKLVTPKTKATQTVRLRRAKQNNNDNNNTNHCNNNNNNKTMKKWPRSILEPPMSRWKKKKQQQKKNIRFALPNPNEEEEDKKTNKLRSGAASIRLFTVHEGYSSAMEWICRVPFSGGFIFTGFLSSLDVGSLRNSPRIWLHRWVEIEKK